MFGYIKPLREQLRIVEDAYYRAVYCGVCRALGQRMGQAARLSLSYDATAMAIFFAACADEPLRVQRIRCPVHPLKARYAAIGPQIDSAADIGLLLAYFKTQDDWQDERKLASRAMGTAWKRAAKRAQGHVPWAEAAIRKGLGDLHRLEREREPQIDAAAEPFARMLEVLFAQNPHAKGPEQAWRWLGYNAGRWLYMVDALDDLERDQQKGCYNPLILAYPGGAQAARENCREAMDFSLTHTLAQAASALDFLPIQRDRGLIENILYQGMPQVGARVLSGEKQKKGGKGLWAGTASISPVEGRLLPDQERKARRTDESI